MADVDGKNTKFTVRLSVSIDEFLTWDQSLVNPSILKGKKAYTPDFILEKSLLSLLINVWLMAD